MYMRDPACLLLPATACLPVPRLHQPPRTMQRVRPMRAHTQLPTATATYRACQNTALDPGVGEGEGPMEGRRTVEPGDACVR